MRITSLTRWPLFAAIAVGWGCYVAFLIADDRSLRGPVLGLLVVGTVTVVVERARRRTEAVAGARYRDGYADGYVDALADRRPARALTLVR